MDIDKRIYLMCKNGIRVISGGVLLFLVSANILFSSYVDYQSERVRIEKNGISAFISALLMLCGLFIVSNLAKKISEKILFCVLAIITLAAGIYLIINVDGTLRFDPLYIYETAVELTEGNYSSLAKDGYLFYFPHQLGMTAYERILLLFSSNTKLIFLFNLMEIIGINFFLWRLTNLLFGNNHVTNVNTILLSFLFLPQFFFILFAYGLLPGLFCLLAAFFFAAAFCRNGKKRCLAAALIFSCLAVLLKENYLIGMIALTIWLLLECLKNKNWKWIIAVMLIIPCCMMSSKLVKGIYELESNVKLGKGVPAMLYIGMGVNPNNETLGPGWFDGSNWSYFTQCNQDSQAAQELAGDLLKTYWKQMCDEPVQAVKFFVKKNISVWTEPLYQSLWSGPQESCGQYVNTQLLQSLYRGERAEHIVYKYMKGFILVILLMSFGFVVKEWEKGEGAILLLLYNIGGFLFHTFWEAKSQYVYPYIFLLIPLCAYMAERIFACRRERYEKNSR